MKTKLYKIAFSVIFICGLFALKSQAQQVRIFSTGNSDLPSNNVTSIAIDAQGNKWVVVNKNMIGTIAKFDDVKWTIYNDASLGIPGNYSIKSIAIDSQDNKWFGTYDASNVNGVGGLVKFDNTNWTVYYSRDSVLTINQINKIAIDAQGNKWIATRNNGVVKFDDTNWTVYNSSNSNLPDDYVGEIEIDDLGNKWFAALGGIVKYDDISWTVYDYNSILPAHEQGLISSIAIDDKGNKWFGVSDESWDPEAAGGVAVFDNENWSFYNSTNSGLPYGVYSIATDAQGTKWFGTAHTWNYWDAAVAKFDGSEWTVYNYANSGLPNVLVSSIATDLQGNKWFGTDNIGVVQFNENGITTGLSDNISSRTDDLILYPNPAKDFISVEGLQSGTFEIFNCSGMVVKNSQIHGSLSKVDISNLPDGIYYIRITTENHVIAKKFVKGY